MKMTPLVMLAAMRVPALTDTFSDVFDIASMVVTASGLTTLITNAPHNLAVGDTVGVAVVDAYAPNTILTWQTLSARGGSSPVLDGDVKLTVTYPHTLSPSPDLTKYVAWNAFARLAHTSVTGLDGNCQLIAVDDELSLVIRPQGTITLPGSPPVNATLLERLERETIGWHTATVVDETTLTYPTPSTIARSYTLTDPKVVTSIRIWGAVDLPSALRHFTRSTESDNILDGVTLDQGYLFVTPRRDIRLSRDRNSSSNATTETQPGAVVRQLLMDGFEIFVALPAERYGGAVGCLDRCHGQILRAVLRTFNGLKLPFTELVSPDAFVSMLSGHRTAVYNRANYVHNYSFESTAYITDGDCAPSILVPDLAALDGAVFNGDPIPTVNPQGTVPISAIVFDPGIFQKERPNQALTATVKVDIEPPA